MSDEKRLDDTPEEPRLFGLTQEAGGYRLTRRDFLRTAAGLAAAAMAGACPSAPGQAVKAAKLQNVHGNKMVLGEGEAGAIPSAHKGAINCLATDDGGTVLA